MKKVFAVLLCVVLVFSLSACGGKKDNDDKPNTPTTMGVVPENPPTKPELKPVGQNGSRTDDPLGFQLELPAVGEKIAVFETTKGNIYMRLFPESAPITVTNFISLVECGYYNGISFHRVMNGFMIQGGDPLGNGTGGTSCWSTKFEDEFNANLLNIRGSLSMANSGLNTNGSQFFINQSTEVPSKNYYDYDTWYKQLYNQNAQGLREEYDQYKTTHYSEFADAEAFIKETIDKYIGKNMILSNTVSDEAWDFYAKYGGNIHLDGAFKGGYGGHSVFAQVFKGMGVVDAIASVTTDDNDKPIDDIIITKAYTTAVTEDMLKDADGAKPIENTGVVIPK